MGAPRVEPRWSDDQVEQFLGNLLRVSVLIAAGITLLGGLVLLFQHRGAAAEDFRVFRGEPSELRSPLTIVLGALHLEGRAIIQFGVVLLLATPVARVAVSLVAFLVQRDRLYVVITSIVLAILLYSVLFSGLVG